MWVDQRALKLTITGPDLRTVEHAAKSVEAFIAAAPIKAGAVEAAVTRSLDCPPHFLDVLGDRATIARIVKETRAQVVVNKKMARVIVRGGPHAVQCACVKVQAIIAAAAAAEHSRQLNASDRSFDRHAHSDAESDIDRRSSSSIRSRAASAIGSPTTSAPASPHSGSGRIWSLFSGPAAFGAAGSAALATPVTAKTTDSLFATYLEDAPGADLLAPVSTLPVRRERAKSAAAAMDRGAEGKPVAAPAARDQLVELTGLLAALKLSKYAPAFEENEVDMDAVCLMTEPDFAELGIPKGPRLKILNAVRALAPLPTASA